MNFDHGLDIMASSRDEETGTLRVALGNSSQPFQETDSALMVAPFGFASRPAKPTPGKPSAQAAIVRTFFEDVCIGGWDRRCQTVYGGLDYGETCVFATTGQARALFKNNGAIALMTKKGNDENGAGLGAIFDAASGTISILSDKGYGIVINGDGIVLTSGKASLTLGSDGSVKLVGTGPTQVDGTSIVLGSAAVPVVNSVLTGPAGILGKPSLKVLCE